MCSRHELQSEAKCTCPVRIQCTAQACHIGHCYVAVQPPYARLIPAGILVAVPNFKFVPEAWYQFHVHHELCQSKRAENA